MPDQLDTSSPIARLLAALAAGELSAEALARDMLARCERHRDLHALIAQDPAQLLEAARAADRRRAAGEPPGPLHGLPILVKDNIDVLLASRSGSSRRACAIAQSISRRSSSAGGVPST